MEEEKRYDIVKVTNALRRIQERYECSEKEAIQTLADTLDEREEVLELMIYEARLLDIIS